MANPHLQSLTMRFLEAEPEGLRLVTQSNLSIEILISSRARLSGSLGNAESRAYLDVPGVYLLVGPDAGPGSDSQKEFQVYVGQGDSVADRLESHLRSEAKKWWRTVLVIRRSAQDPLNLSQCRFLESSLHSRAVSAGIWALANKVVPQAPFLAPNEQRGIEDFLEKALGMVSALGFSGFASSPPAQEPPGSTGVLPFTPPPTNLQPLVEEIHRAATGESFPRAEWYSTFCPDYRAKVVGKSGDFRVFVRVKWAKNWLWLQLPKLGKHKIARASDVDDGVRKEIAASYHRAEQYLERGR